MAVGWVVGIGDEWGVVVVEGLDSGGACGLGFGRERGDGGRLRGGYWDLKEVVLRWQWVGSGGWGWVGVVVVGGPDGGGACGLGFGRKRGVGATFEGRVLVGGVSRK